MLHNGDERKRIDLLLADKLSRTTVSRDSSATVPRGGASKSERYAPCEHRAGNRELRASSNSKSPCTEPCYSCGKLRGSMRRCGHCYHAWYCSPQCQARGWTIHKLACKRLIAFASQTSTLARELDELHEEYGEFRKRTSSLQLDFDALSVQCQEIIRNNGDVSAQCQEVIRKNGEQRSELATLVDVAARAAAAEARAEMLAHEVTMLREKVQLAQSGCESLARENATLSQKLFAAVAPHCADGPAVACEAKGQESAGDGASTQPLLQPKTPEKMPELRVAPEASAVEQVMMRFERAPRWQYEAGRGAWEDYPADISLALDKCAAKKRKKFCYSRYEISVVGLSQTNIETGTARAIRRCDVQQAAAPYHVSCPHSDIARCIDRLAALDKDGEGGGKDNVLVWLKTDDEQYKALVAVFAREIPGVTVTKVGQNLSRRFQLYQQLGKHVGNEVHLLWHGSRGTDPRLILREGLDPRVAKEGYLGHGVYLAHSPRYCNAGGYAHDMSRGVSSAERRDERVLIACRAHLGRVQFIGPVDASTAQRARVRPERGFDSLAAMVADGQLIHAVYHPDQVYPAYVVHYVSGAAQQ